MDWELAISIFISLIALGISFASFYYIHLQGPKFRVKHHSCVKRDQTETRAKYGHRIIVINDGNKTGVLENVSLENVDVEMLLSDKDNDNKVIGFPVSIKPKESLNLFGVYQINKKNGGIPFHKIVATFEDSHLIGISSDKKEVWNSSKGC